MAPFLMLSSVISCSYLEISHTEGTWNPRNQQLNQSPHAQPQLACLTRTPLLVVLHIWIKCGHSLINMHSVTLTLIGSHWPHDLESRHNSISSLKRKMKAKFRISEHSKVTQGINHGKPASPLNSKEKEDKDEE